MSDYQKYNDTELLELLKNGNEQAFTQVYNRYSEKLYYNILAMVKDETTSEELLQDIFSHIWQKRASIIINKNFDAYLFVISRNKVYDFFRQLKREKALYTRIREIATSEYNPFEEALTNENEDLLHKAIASLPPQRRKVFELCKIEGISYLQASQKMGVSLSTIKDHMAHAQSSIRMFVEQHNEIAIGLAFLYLWKSM